MYYIDVNCMIGDWAHNLKFSTVGQLQAEMQRLNIAKSLVFHSSSWMYDPKYGNNQIIDVTKGSENLIPVISLTTLIKQEFGGKSEVMNFIRSNGVGAVRLFPNDHNYTLNLWNVDDLFSVLNELRIPVLLECRPLEGNIESGFSQLYDLAETYKDTPIILLTVGYRNLRVFYKLFERCSNIRIDTSTFITFRGIEDVYNNFGPERILFGTRMPFIEAGVSVGRLIYAEISQEAKEKIAYKNALELLKALPWLNIGRSSENEA